MPQLAYLRNLRCVRPKVAAQPLAQEHLPAVDSRAPRLVAGACLHVGALKGSSDTQVLEYSGTAVLRYSGTGVTRVTPVRLTLLRGTMVPGAIAERAIAPINESGYPPAGSKN